MAGITKAEREAFESEFIDIFRRLEERVKSDARTTEQGIVEAIFLSLFPKGTLRRLKEEAMNEFRRKIEDETEWEAYRKAKEALLGAHKEVLRIKGISISDFNALERMEPGWILHDFNL